MNVDDFPYTKGARFACATTIEPWMDNMVVYIHEDRQYDMKNFEETIDDAEKGFY
jgi:hypothetical protein